jgi:hypothetical protein
MFEVTLPMLALMLTIAWDQYSAKIRLLMERARCLTYSR